MNSPILNRQSNHLNRGPYHVSRIDRFNARCDGLFRRLLIGGNGDREVPYWQRFLFGLVLPWCVIAGWFLLELSGMGSILSINRFTEMVGFVGLILGSPIWIIGSLAVSIAVADRPWRSRIAMFLAGLLSIACVITMTLIGAIGVILIR